MICEVSTIGNYSILATGSAASCSETFATAHLVSSGDSWTYGAVEKVQKKRKLSAQARAVPEENSIKDRRVYNPYGPTGVTTIYVQIREDLKRRRRRHRRGRGDDQIKHQAPLRFQ